MNLRIDSVSRNVVDLWSLLFKEEKRTNEENQGFHSKMAVLILISRGICKVD